MGRPRVFLDANILFSAAYKDGSRLRWLWEMKNVKLITSQYALEEARRNLSKFGETRIEALEILMKSMLIVLESRENSLKDAYGLPEKDRPILRAAVNSKSDYLLTGDFQHFGNLFGHDIEGTTILTPAMFLSKMNTLHP